MSIPNIRIFNSFHWHSHICKIVVILPRDRGGFMSARSKKFKIDFMPIGQGIKQAREAKDITRERLAEIVDYGPRHIQGIENEGKTPSVDLLFQLA